MMNLFRKPAALLLSVLLIAAATVTAIAETYGDGSFEFEKTDKNNGIIVSCSLSDEDITVPEFVLGYPIAGIGDYAFMSLPGLRTVTMPEAVVSIGEYAFAENPNLVSVRIPRACNSISDNAFANSQNVTIIGYADSFAKTYAETNGLRFEAAEPTPQPTTEKLTEQVTTEPVTEKPTEQVTTEPVTEKPTEQVTTVPVTEKPTEEVTTEPTTGKMNEPPLPTAKLSKSSLKLKSGAAVTVKVRDGEARSWKSSNPKVAAVKNGKVTALRKGSAKIIVSLTNGLRLTCKVSVTTSPTIKIGKKKWSKSAAYSVKKGKTLTVSITGKAKTVNNIYRTTDKKLAKITSKSSASKAVIKAYKKGKATVTLTVNGVSFGIKLKIS